MFVVIVILCKGLSAPQTIHNNNNNFFLSNNIIETVN